MKIVAVIPIKLNNERLPNKNILPFKNGKPLINYILETVSKIKEIDKIYVYCSNEEIKKYLPKNIRFLKRSKDLDQNTTKMNEILKKFSEEIESEVYILFHATSPFIKKESIEIGISKVLKEDYDSSFSVHKIQDFIWKNNKPWNYNLENIPRTQDLEKIYLETSGFYIFKKEIIMKNKRIGENPYLLEVSKIESVDIDDEEDFKIAESIYNNIIKNDKN
jgi:CMP-N-acetylneuraminic acid synthetase